MNEKSRSGEIWSTEEENFLIQNHKKITYKQMGLKLGRSIHAVKKRISMLDEIRKSSYIKWSEKEDLFLLENLNHMTYRAIGLHLGRTHRAVERRSLFLKHHQRNNSVDSG